MGATAVVIGATGLVGRALVGALDRAGHVERVRAVVRRAAPAPSPKVEFEVVDFERLDERAPLFACDLFFSCLGTTAKQAGSVEAQRKVDVDMQFQAARLARAGGARHALLLSSAGADARSSNAYLQMKGELEDKILTLGFPRVSIFQPSLLLGARAGDHRPMELFGAALGGVLAVIPVLRRYRPIPAEQVAAKMAQVSAEPGPAVERFVLDELFDLAPGS